MKSCPLLGFRATIPEDKRKMQPLLIFAPSLPRKVGIGKKLETQTAEIRFKPVKVLAKFRLWQMMIVWLGCFSKIDIFHPKLGKGRPIVPSNFFTNEMELNLKFKI